MYINLCIPGHAPCDTMWTPAHFAMHLLAYVMPSEPQTGTYSSEQGHSEQK